MKKMIIAREPVDDSHLPSHLHPVIKQIYATRNVCHADELNNSAATLLDFKLFKDIDKASQLLIDALHAQSKILIVGDFDADGATSTTNLCPRASIYSLITGSLTIGLLALSIRI